MRAYGEVHLWLIVGLAVALIVRARDYKFGWGRCVACGERGEHKVGCPGRRGY